MMSSYLIFPPEKNKQTSVILQPTLSQECFQPLAGSFPLWRYVVRAVDCFGVVVFSKEIFALSLARANSNLSKQQNAKDKTHFIILP